MAEIKKIRVAITATDDLVHEYYFDVPDEPIGIDAFIEYFQPFCDQLVALDLSRVASSCRKGCAVCCNQMVPLSSGEVIYLNRLFDSFEKTRQEALAQKMQQITETFEQKRKKDGEKTKASIDQQYFQLGIPCPFLEDKACSIYEKRPFICREYHVSSDPSLCEDPYTNTPERIGKGTNFGTLMMVFCAQLFGLPQIPVPLFQMKEWGKAYKELPGRRYPAAWLFERFLDGMVKAKFKESVIQAITWKYVGENDDEEKVSPLFLALADGHKAFHQKKVKDLLEEGAIIRNGKVLPPMQLPKLLTQTAGAENIKHIFTELIKIDETFHPEDIFIEIGSGDGYLKYLLSLTEDKEMLRLMERMIETEPSVSVVEENLERGKHTIALGISDLAAHFGETVTPLIVSMNVLDVFPEEQLKAHLKMIYSVLKDKGLILHIMSSAIHKAVFEDIETTYPGKVYLPFCKDDYIGVRVASEELVTKADSPPPLHGAADLARLFAQRPDEYIRLAREADHWFNEHETDSTQILLHQFSLDKISQVMGKTGFDVIYCDTIHASRLVSERAEHIKTARGCDFKNQAGALMINPKRSSNQGELTEEAVFGVLLGRKQ